MSRHAVRLVPLAVLLALLSPTACGGASSHPSATTGTGGVHGVAMAGGGPLPGDSTPSPWPVRNVAVLVREGDVNGVVVARVKTDQAGKFSVDLPPGTYTLIQSVPGGAEPKTVTVSAGQYVEVTLWQHVP
jgi:hypothetical protein